MSLIYVAGASAEADIVANYIARLRRDGWSITHDWTTSVQERQWAGLDDRTLTDEERHRYAAGDLDGVRRCEVFWLMIPAGLGGCGCWVELGAACAMRKRVVVSGDYRRTIFTSHAEQRFDSHNEALRWVGAQ